MPSLTHVALLLAGLAVPLTSEDLCSAQPLTVPPGVNQFRLQSTGVEGKLICVGWNQGELGAHHMFYLPRSAYFTDAGWTEVPLTGCPDPATYQIEEAGQLADGTWWTMWSTPGSKGDDGHLYLQAPQGAWHELTNLMVDGVGHERLGWVGRSTGNWFWSGYFAQTPSGTMPDDYALIRGAVWDGQGTVVHDLDGLYPGQPSYVWDVSDDGRYATIMVADGINAQAQEPWFNFFINIRFGRWELGTTNVVFPGSLPAQNPVDGVSLTDRRTLMGPGGQVFLGYESRQADPLHPGDDLVQAWTALWDGQNGSTPVFLGPHAAHLYVDASSIAWTGDGWLIVRHHHYTTENITNQDLVVYKQDITSNPDLLADLVACGSFGHPLQPRRDIFFHSQAFIDPYDSRIICVGQIHDRQAGTSVNGPMILNPIPQVQATWPTRSMLEELQTTPDAVTITVDRSCYLNDWPLTVHMNLSGVAQANTDFLLTGASSDTWDIAVTIPAHQDRASFTMTVLPDGTFEPTESIDPVLAGDTGESFSHFTILGPDRCPLAIFGQGTRDVGIRLLDRRGQPIPAAFTLDGFWEQEGGASPVSYPHMSPREAHQVTAIPIPGPAQ